MLDFRVETFLTVCRTMNYTRAAEELNITQPAVSQHIAHLERDYGVPLFAYRNKKLQLTDAGALLRERRRNRLRVRGGLFRQECVCVGRVPHRTAGVRVRGRS